MHFATKSHSFQYTFLLRKTVTKPRDKCTTVLEIKINFASVVMIESYEPNVDIQVVFKVLLR